MTWELWAILAAAVLFFGWAAWRMRGRTGDITDPRQHKENRLWNESGGGAMPPGA